MSAQTQVKRKSVTDIRALKSKSQPVVCLTSYIKPIAQLADRHADLILVGDSLGMVLYGLPSTLGVTLDMMMTHGRAVVDATTQALVAIDMPFGSYQESPQQAFRNAALLMANTGCQAVKLEGGCEMAETVSFLTQRGIPVIGHVGLQPQSVNSAGGYRVTGRADHERASLMKDAQSITEAGAFAIVLECMDEELARDITNMVAIPTIGIGASVACDGQILVTEDLLGLTGGPVPRFVKQYAHLAEQIDSALQSYAGEVREKTFPSDEFIYRSSAKSKLRVAD